MIPKSLKRLFIIHFLVDISFAIPLMIFPGEFLTFLGWETVDPFSSRLVAAALFGIGGASFVTRNKSLESYESLLDLKIIWSLAAIFGTLLNLIQGAPFFGWVILAIFTMFSAIWIYYRIDLKNQEHC
jgi:hypothetical protein